MKASNLATLLPVNLCLSLGVAIACAGCSLVFSAGEFTPDEDANPEVDASLLPSAGFSVSEPSCGDNIYLIDAEASTATEGASVAAFRWVLAQGDTELAEFENVAEVAVPTSTHVLGGTHISFSLRPSLFSAPNMLSVTLGNSDGSNQVYQTDLVIEGDLAYELSFVAFSASNSKFKVKLFEEVTFAELGLNEDFETTPQPKLFSTVFTSIAPATPLTPVRLQLLFDNAGAFSIDNLQLRRVEAQGNLVQNGEFRTGMKNWTQSFPGGGIAMLQDVPSLFPDTTLSLVVVDSLGNESSAAEATISAPDCP